MSTVKTIAERAEEFFFKGMLNGYLSDKKPDDHPTLFLWKQLIYTDGEFTLDDSWHDRGGYTKILLEETVIWVMKYEGWYSTETGVIPLLKAALRKAYTQGEFNGGRGPEELSHHNLTYQNRWVGRNRGKRRGFEKFRGAEGIYDFRRDPEEQCFGLHKYSGMLLIQRHLI